MRNIIAAVLLVAAVALGLNGIRQAQGPKPDNPCIWPFCSEVAQGPKPDRPWCQACVALNARNQALVQADINRGHQIPVGFAPVN